MVHQPRLPLQGTALVRSPHRDAEGGRPAVAPVDRRPARRRSRLDDWRLDDRTRRAGRVGLAAAREALARAQARADAA